MTGIDAFFTVVLQGGEATGVIDVVLRTGMFAKSILLLIFFLSVFAWAIMYHKYRQFKRLSQENGRFLQKFRKAASLDDALISSREFSGSSMTRIMHAGFEEFKELSNPGDPSRDLGSGAGMREGVSMALERAASREVLNLERYLVFLAVVSTVAPFLGLLGTVWGIMRAFIEISAFGSANLSIVGPGIAEALITTIAGLGAAIPAVMGYNYFSVKIKSMSDEMDIFGSEFLGRLIRQGVL
jgi:biopolymer transport protein TolQ